MAGVNEFTVCLFQHTKQGEAALHTLHAAGVPHDTLHVIGDLGTPASLPGAEDHTTFDRLHIPADLRTLFMDTIRAGGVVLAVDTEVISAGEVERIGTQHHVLRVERTSALDSNPSHNAAN